MDMNARALDIFQTTNNGRRAVAQPSDPIIRAVAFHLPQFHPIAENDEWWGKGFTEWTNVVKAKPRFPGHYQPHLPADLGFYDLRLPEARAAQAQLAASYGIYGFCYYHYWFNGRRLLERPVKEICKSGEPDFPFCLCWANENWTRRWDGQDSEILLEQKYGREDDLAHIRSLMPVFLDRRYIRIEDRPLFLIYRASGLPEPERTTELWRREAERAGLKGLFLARVESFGDWYGDPRSIGFDCSVDFQPRWELMADARIFRRKWWHVRRLGTHERGIRENKVFEYKLLVENALAAPTPAYPRVPCVCPSWDSSPRRKHDAYVLMNSTPELYEQWLSGVVNRTKPGDCSEISADSLVFINAWNEWGEGNHLEPCQKWARQYLEATRRVLGTPTSQSAEYVQRKKSCGHAAPATHGIISEE
jgi:lipopolysaccharide biosynthesis protein